MQILSLISDTLLLCATIGMAIWFRLLSRRLRSSDDVEKGFSDMITKLTARIDSLEVSLGRLAGQKDERAERLHAETARADDRIGRMELLLASLDDLEERAADRFPSSTSERDDAVVLPSFRAARPQATMEVDR